jgi:hypothetical protein
MHIICLFLATAALHLGSCFFPSRGSLVFVQFRSESHSKSVARSFLISHGTLDHHTVLVKMPSGVYKAFTVCPSVHSLSSIRTERTFEDVSCCFCSDCKYFIRVPILEHSLHH